jgi:hypothetical protein
MKIEYLSHTDPAYPNESIFRIFDFDTNEASKFREIVSKLAQGKISESELNELPFIVPVEGCRLVLKTGAKNRGIVEVSKKSFECILKKEAWGNAHDLIEPFCDYINSNVYQWLYDLDTDIELLFSPTGKW